MSRFPCWVRDPLFQPKNLEYREPFFGSGAVGFQLLSMLPSNARVWLNDQDYSLVCLWKSVKESSEELIEMVRRFEPSTDAFDKFKEEDGAPGIEPVTLGFQKLALHQISFSGNGVKAGGPIGGRKQRSEFNADFGNLNSRIHKYLPRSLISSS